MSVKLPVITLTAILNQSGLRGFAPSRDTPDLARSQATVIVALKPFPAMKFSGF